MKRREFLKAALLTTAAANTKRSRLFAQPSIAGQGEVRRVLVVFKCHLDVGFTDTQANVMQTYFKQYYPQAISTAERLRGEGKSQYVWTTGSWLLYEYLEQATKEERRRMEAAINAGDIAWHALPFSWQTELLDRSMIQGCLGFSSSLDARFGRKTIAGKMTDVPGHSRGLVPVLADDGIELLDIGVNSASTPPDVPDIFLWKAPNGKSLAVIYHRHDYGSVVQVPGSDLAVDIGVRNDNSGPHTADEIAAIYAKLEKRFPKARISAANLSDVALALRDSRSSLPVFTEEIGDTWIYGAPSDPVKLARYREMARLRQEWIAAGRLAIGETEDRQLLRRLALAVEHTWGTDTKRYIDHEHYPPKELGENLGKPNYQVMERSWQEKRDDIDAGVGNLREELRSEAERRLSSLKVMRPEFSGMSSADARTTIHTTHFEVQIDAKAGAIQKLTSKRSGISWASAEHPLALFTYQTLSQADYSAFLATYVQSKESWAPQDFGKPNIDRFQAKSQNWQPSLRRLWVAEDTENHRVISELGIDDPTSEQAGLLAWPKAMYLELTFPKAESVVHITFYSFGKIPNRMPEAMWLTFKPQVPKAAVWKFEKVNEEVLATEVVRGGARRMHAVSNRLVLGDRPGAFEIATLDAPVVAVDTRSPLNFNYELPDLQHGIHINLFNNAWGTNYPQWAGGDWKYRFRLSFGSQAVD